MFPRLRLFLLHWALVIGHWSFGADAPPPALPPRADFHLYLLMGQSNMAGRGVLDAAPPADHPRILALAPDGQWLVARDPLHVKIGRTEPGVGPGLSFARELAEADPRITVGLIPCAVGGSPLRRWTKGGDLYAQAVARALSAAQIGTLRGVLWHQGETDADKPESAATYGERLARLIADLREDLGQPGLPVVVGQLGDFVSVEKHPGADLIRAALQNLPAAVPHVAFADSTGLGHKGDHLHFDTPATRELGLRFARALRTLDSP